MILCVCCHLKKKKNCPFIHLFACRCKNKNDVIFVQQIMRYMEEECCANDKC